MKEEIRKEIAFLYSIANNGNREEIIEDISGDLNEKYRELDQATCIHLVKEVLSNC